MNGGGQVQWETVVGGRIMVGGRNNS
jgi:hypothetical protein